MSKLFIIRDRVIEECASIADCSSDYNIAKTIRGLKDGQGGDIDDLGEFKRGMYFAANIAECKYGCTEQNYEVGSIISEEIVAEAKLF